MDGGHRHMVLGELDLATYHAASLSDNLSVLPTLRMSAAFFTFLRANLALGQPPAHPPSSSAPTSTPTTISHRPSSSSSSAIFISSAPSSVFSSLSSSISSPSPSTASSISDPDQVSLSLLTDPDDRLAALELVAQSIRQQRTTATLALARHPLSIFGLVATLLLIWNLPGRRSSLALRTALCTAVVGACALAAWLVARRYLSLADEQTGNDFLWGPYGPGSQDLVLGARSDETGELVGALVLRIQQPSQAGGSGRRRTRTASMRGGKGVIRAWTTAAEHRRKGIGADMLYEAIRLARERCGRDAAVGFAREHVNSTMVLPATFNGPFLAVERRAARALDGAAAEWEANKKRRRA